MTLKRWFVEQEPKWQRLEALLAAGSPTGNSLSPLAGLRGQARVLSLAEIREMGLLYRDAINDLARVQSTPEYQHLEPYLNHLVQRCHGRIYERPPTRVQDIARFFRRDFPRCFRRNAWFVLLAAFMFWFGAAVAMLTVAFNPQTERFFLPPPVIEQLERGVLWTDHSAATPSEATFLMTNNIRVAINAFALGTLFGIGTLVLLLHNGMFAFGGPMQVCIHHGMGGRLLNFIAAHGVIELTTIFIAGAAGMIIGFALLFPGDLPRWLAVRQKARDALVLILGCVPLLVIAGLIEGLISLNQAMGPPVRWAVALASAVCLGAYLGLSGREGKD